MLDKTFNPKEAEGRIYREWEESGAFKPGRRPAGEPFCIVIPPPNVTGSLHVGHALNNTLQDALVRFERMRGKDVLWQAGLDHAGIATQLVVERRLAERQMNRKSMGREKFIEEIWRWKAESGGTIVSQLRRLGASCDWSRERFTMDEGLSRAVIKVFVQLHREGLIYKDKRLVNWDPRLQTAVSDLEVESIEMKGKLWYIKYPLADDPSRFVTVATTRPETMLGDTAVAVHPEDERYRDLVGKMVRLPLAGREIPIIADEHSDPEKGTGAVKITPGHDFNDFAVGRRHDLDVINILTPEARLRLKGNWEFWGSPSEDRITAIQRRTIELLDGKDRFEGRKIVVAELESLGLIEKADDIVHAVPHDEKTKTVVLEPYLTDQWYLNVDTLAAKAIEAVEQGKTRFVPEHWTGVYFNWMRNIQPWCISRQLWWGHQIPVWYGPEFANNTINLGADVAFVEETEDAALKKARNYYKGLQVEVAQTLSEYMDAKFGGAESHQLKILRDPDVLDTWFSSALWAFSTLGWPEQTPELKRFYPTSVLVTGFDIIFFWVARMMMMGLHFMKEVPFHDVVIHTRVLDEKGTKMSKTKGNVVDPVELIDEFGADALRFALAIAAGQGRDIRLGSSRVETARNFTTKLWNAARFCEMNGCARDAGFAPEKCTATVNRWILDEARTAAAAVSANLEAYRFNDAAGAVYQFVWSVFCDWYLEFIKPILLGADEDLKAETRACAAFVLDQILKLLHPFMPFITEELWARTGERGPQRESLLIVAEWPDLNYPTFPEANAEKMWVIDVVSNIRTLRSDLNVPVGARPPLLMIGGDTVYQQRLEANSDVIIALSRLSEVKTSTYVPAASGQFILSSTTFAVPLEGIIDFAKERMRLEKELKKAEDEIARFDAKLNNEAFVARAPEEVIEEQRGKRAEAAALAARLKEAVARLA